MTKKTKLNKTKRRQKRILCFVTIVDGLGDCSVMERGDDISISGTRDSNKYEYERKG